MSTSGSVARGAARRSAAFRERARQEADRYGPDPWIFVRELLQNSRDAGATAVRFSVEDGGGREVVRCTDDGEGMSFAHAKRYLFALYASSKETSRNQAGKFGVGFWSILRFEPDEIIIRCRTRAGESWGLRFDGTLEHAVTVPGLTQSGTEIIVARHGGDGRLEHRVYDAVWQSARYLHRRDNVREALPITINGRRANAEFALEAPSAAFRRGSVRGVVGLGPAPRVELFSRGLRLRAAASLDDLIAPSGRHTSRMRVQFPELPGGLAPQALLESDKLQVLLSRSDARDNRALNRLVKLAHRELEWLIDRQLSAARPRSIFRQAWDFFGDRLRESLLLRTVLGSFLGATAALLIGWALWGRTVDDPPARVETRPTAPARGPTAATPRPYQDLAARYRGPRVDVLEPGSAEPIELRYLPSSRRLHFAALSFSELAADGSPVVEPADASATPYRGLSCDRNCVDVEVPISGPGQIHVPIPTGHRLVVDSLRADNVRLPVMMTPEGLPVITLSDATERRLRYRTVAGPDPRRPQTPAISDALPRSLRNRAAAVRTAMVEDRVAALLAEVKARVEYDRSAEVASQHADAVDRGVGFVDRTLEIGAGDCDVQNGLLVALLHAAGVEARLAVGYIGSEGRVFPWLHAWVEYRNSSGAWRVADASEGAQTALPALPQARPAAAAPSAPSDPGPAPDGRGPEPAEPSIAAPPAQQDAAPETQPEGEVAAAPTAAGASTPASSSAEDDDDLLSLVRRLDRDYPWVIRGMPFLLFALAAWSMLGARTRRAVKLDDTPDLSRLLRGVLQQPGAFAQMSSLFTRPIVPCLEGDAISVNRARELAAQGRLYSSADRPALARRAVKSKAVVLDVTTPEGRTVADSLGAIDLDRWAAWVDRARHDPLTTRVNAILRRRGEDWCVTLADRMPTAVTVLDLGKLGAKVERIHGARLVLLDPFSPGIAQATETAKRAPKLGTLMLLDLLADRLDLDATRRARLLSDAAEQALLESFPPR
ncbi:MAG: transglutaminase domain-containing protein [Myxococcota bacterium]